MKKLIDIRFSAILELSVPILTTLKDDGYPLNLGAVTLSVEGRDFIIDPTSTNFKNGKETGSKLTSESKLEVDTDTFPIGDGYNYELLVSDLKHKDLKATVYIGCDDYDQTNIDFDKAERLLIISVDGEKLTIKLEEE